MKVLIRRIIKNKKVRIVISHAILFVRNKAILKKIAHKILFKFPKAKGIIRGIIRATNSNTFINKENLSKNGIVEFEALVILWKKKNETNY